MMQLRIKISKFFQTFLILSIFVGLFFRGKADEVRAKSVPKKTSKPIESKADILLAELGEELGEGAAFIPYRFRMYHDVAAALLLDHAMNAANFDPHSISDNNANEEFKTLMMMIRKMPGINVIDNDHHIQVYDEIDYEKLSNVLTKFLGKFS